MSPSHLLSLSLILILLHTLSFLPPLSLYASLSLPLSHLLVCRYHFYFLQLFSFTPLHSLPLFLLLMCFFSVISVLISCSQSLLLSPSKCCKMVSSHYCEDMKKAMKERRVLYQIIKIYIEKCLLAVYEKKVGKAPRLLLSKLDNA